MSCESGYNLLEVRENLIRNCAWSEEKESFDACAEAIGFYRNKTIEITHGICSFHRQEFLQHNKQA